MNRTIILLAGAVLVLALGMLRPPAPEAAARPSQQDRVSVIYINPDRDTYVAQGEEAVVGTASHLRAGAKNGAEYLSLMHFPFPAYMGTDSQIISATVRLRCEETEEWDAANRNFELRLLATGNWDEQRTIYKNKPNATGSPILWVMNQCEDEWIESPDIGETVRRWYSGDVKNNGLQLGPRSSDLSTLFLLTSREGSPPWPTGYQPELVVHAILPPTPSPTASDTPTPSITPTASDTPTPSMTPTITDTPEFTDTPTPTDTPTATPTREGPPDIYLPFASKGSGSEPPATDTPGSTTPEVTADPTEEGTADPTEEGTVEPTEEGTAEPTPNETVEPTTEP